MVGIEELNFEYTRGQNLFEKLVLNLTPGNVYGLLGKNGAGKTTLLKLIAGLLFPLKGRCDVLGYRPGERSPFFLREIFFIPEEFYLPPVRIDEYLAIYGPFYPRFDRGQFATYRNNFNIPDNPRLSNLSYGQKKKFLLAFGLATDCRLLILDEPTNGLDIPTKSQFRKLLAASLTEERTFLISTHQVRDMENLIDPIIILDEGEIIFQADMAEVTGKLMVKLQTAEPVDDSVLYHEKVLGGYAVIQPNSEGIESKIDLEILFNAIINNRDTIKTMFNREVAHVNS
ncbi:MAG: ABC transporter ATP-binding protein [Candidatus Neomarinimicrobiota bacterium]